MTSFQLEKKAHFSYILIKSSNKRQLSKKKKLNEEIIFEVLEITSFQLEKKAHLSYILIQSQSKRQLLSKKKN